MICLVDERISEKCERGLLKRGFQIIKMPRSASLSAPIASHPDMLVFYHNGCLISSSDYCERYPYIFSDIREFSETSMTFTSESHSPTYPKDAIFNALTVGKHIFYKEDTVSDSLKEYASRKGLITVPVKQGYPACTVLAFGNSAITADEGMAIALKKSGISVTLISNGDISLPPYEYGFIGGASGVYKNTVYFLGNPLLHRDGDKIAAAIADAGYDICPLADEPLADLGRIIFIE